MCSIPLAAGFGSLRARTAVRPTPAAPALVAAAPASVPADPIRSWRRVSGDKGQSFAVVGQWEKTSLPNGANPAAPA
jgi:hypothetical protein